MKTLYIFHSSCFDKELLRQQIISLDDHSIDYQVFDKSGTGSFKAPLSVYFEAEIHISENDFEKADQLLASFSE